MEDLELAASHVSQALIYLRRKRTSESEVIAGELQPIMVKIENLQKVKALAATAANHGQASQ